MSCHMYLLFRKINQQSGLKDFAKTDSLKMSKTSKIAILSLVSRTTKPLIKKFRLKIKTNLWNNISNFLQSDQKTLENRQYFPTPCYEVTWQLCRASILFWKLAPNKILITTSKYHTPCICCISNVFFSNYKKSCFHPRWCHFLKVAEFTQTSQTTDIVIYYKFEMIEHRKMQESLDPNNCYEITV